LGAKNTNNSRLLNLLSENELRIADIINYAENNLFQLNLSAKIFAESLRILILHNQDRALNNNKEQMHKLFFELPFTTNNSINFYLTILQNDDELCLSYLQDNGITSKTLLTHSFETKNLFLIEKLLLHPRIKADLNIHSTLINPIKHTMKEHYQKALLNNSSQLVQLIEDSGFANNLNANEAADLWLSINKESINNRPIGQHSLTEILNFAKNNFITRQEGVTLSKLQLLDIITYQADIEYLKQIFFHKNDLTAIEYFLQKLETEDNRALEILSKAGITSQTLLEHIIKYENFLAFEKLINNYYIKYLLTSKINSGENLRASLKHSYDLALGHNNQNWTTAIAPFIEN
jgi:hypothetical protein